MSVDLGDWSPRGLADSYPILGSLVGTPALRELHLLQMLVELACSAS
jgi:hypothetical protein